MILSKLRTNMFPVLDSNYMRTNAMTHSGLNMSKIQIETQGHTFVFKINIEYKYITQGPTYFLVRIQN